MRPVVIPNKRWDAAEAEPGDTAARPARGVIPANILIKSGKCGFTVAFNLSSVTGVEDDVAGYETEAFFKYLQSYT